MPISLLWEAVHVPDAEIINSIASLLGSKFSFKCMILAEETGSMVSFPFIHCLILSQAFFFQFLHE